MASPKLTNSRNRPFFPIGEFSQKPQVLPAEILIASTARSSLKDLKLLSDPLQLKTRLENKPTSVYDLNEDGDINIRTDSYSDVLAEFNLHAENGTNYLTLNGNGSLNLFARFNIYNKQKIFITPKILKNVANYEFNLQQGAELELYIFNIYGEHTANTIAINQDFNNSCLKVKMLNIAKVNIDNWLDAKITGKGCKTDIEIRTLGLGNSTTATKGNIIANHCPGLEANYQEKAISTNNQCVIASNPILSIDQNDDLTASHGSTISNLDPKAIHYGKSRGLEEKELIQMLLDSFISPVLPTTEVYNKLKLRTYLNSCYEQY